MCHTTCENCAYFCQHYSLRERKIFQVYCGHCTFERPTRKRPDTKACKHFTPGSADTEAFVTKEYLTKMLLHRILELDLLPEIFDDSSLDVPPK